MRKPLLSQVALRIDVVLLTVCLVYGNSLQNGFHFDDFHTVTDNPAIRSLANIPRFFSDATTFSVLPANRTYRPFVSTSLAIDYALGHGYVPFWFHVGTLAVLLLLLAAMFWLFRHLLRSVAVNPGLASNSALFAIAWYGLHPALAETVNYIIQRGDMYSAVGVVGSLALFACRPNLRPTGLYLLPFVFGMLSKPTTIVLPAMLFAYVLMFESEPLPGKSAWLRAGIATVPSLTTGLAALALQSAMTPKSFAPATISHTDYLLTQPYVLLRYFGTFFLPLHLNVDSDLQPFHSLTSQAVAGFVFVAAVIATVALTTRHRTLRPISYGLLWFLVASVPTSVYTLSEVENDHRMVLPFVGLTLAVSWTLALLAARFVPASKLGRYALFSSVLTLLAAYACGTYRRNIVWRTDESLWLDDVQKSPHNGRGLMNYGLTQMAKGDYWRARDYFTRALQYTPNYPTLEINLGIVNGELNDAADAERHFQRAILLAPVDDQTHFYYGRWLTQTSRLTEALPQLEESVQLNPARIPPRDLLAQTLAASGDTSAAVAVARETVALAPDDAAAHVLIAHPPAPNLDAQANGWINLSLSRYQQQDFPGTIAAARQALQLEPLSALAWNNIAAADASLGEWDAAIAAADKALHLQPGFQLASNNRAWAMAEKAKAQTR
jgi:tetratricopeptide (TPR) repeat protein